MIPQNTVVIFLPNTPQLIRKYVPELGFCKWKYAPPHPGPANVFISDGQEENFALRRIEISPPKYTRSPLVLLSKLISRSKQPASGVGSMYLATVLRTTHHTALSGGTMLPALQHLHLQRQHHPKDVHQHLHHLQHLYLLSRSRSSVMG